MIRVEIVADLKPLYDLQLFMQAFPRLFEESVFDAFNREVKPFLLSELQHEPGPAKMPFGFETEKSRRWYFANKVPKPPKGEKRKPGNYVRTHKLSQGWQVGISIDDELIAISASNKAKYEKYVTGPRQVSGHAVTGWQKRQQTIDFWTNASTEIALRQVDNVLKGKF